MATKGWFAWFGGILLAMPLGIVSDAAADQYSSPSSDAIQLVNYARPCANACESPAACEQTSESCDVSCFSGCENGCGCGSLYQQWLAADPWTLPQPCIFQKLGIKTGGWLEAGITTNGNHAGDYDGPAMGNDVYGAPQMNQFWLYFDRAVETGGCGFDIGGRFDLVYGTDWRLAYAHGMGLQEKLNGSDQLYGLCIPQLYTEVGYNDLRVKIGYMCTSFGYEQVPPMLNFFYSHSYNICYAEPLLVTGVMAQHPLGRYLTLKAGFHQGVAQFEDYNDCLNFEGGVSWHNCNKSKKLSYMLDVGRNDPAGLEDEYIHSLVYQWKFAPKWEYVFQNDYGVENNVQVLGGKTANWYGISQYLFYQLNDQWRAGMRVECFRDEDGVRVAGIGNLPDARGWDGKPGFAGTFTELTFGLNWIPKPNFRVRPELRWDWYSGTRNLDNELPFDGGRGTDQFTFATDFIWMF